MSKRLSDDYDSIKILQNVLEKIFFEWKVSKLPKFATELNEQMMWSNQKCSRSTSFKSAIENDHFHFSRDTNMAKISKSLLKTIFLSSVSAQNFEVFSCNDETLDVSKEKLRYQKIACFIKWESGPLDGP